MFKRNLLKAEIVKNGLGNKEVSEELGVGINTLIKKYNNGNFKRAEIEKLINLLNIENPMEIFFSKED